ncbi:Gti1/Pac2 family-domain-containing protein, partial [Amylostereum chailletii]
MDRQSPTCTNVFIRTVADVHRIFYGVLLEKLPMIHRRLDAQEREALTSGCCYVWEDRGPHAITGLGIERFTEGRHWSASRVRDDFLFYYEKWKSSNADDAHSQPPPRNWDPFVKQTYSVYVNPNPGKPETTRRKWHLTAYFTQATVDQLGSVDDIEALRDLAVPEGMFRSSRTIKPR